MIDRQNNICYGGLVNKSVNNFSGRAARFILSRGSHDILVLAITVLLLISIRPVAGQTLDFTNGAGGALIDGQDWGTNDWNPNAGIFISEIEVTNIGVISSFNSLTLDTFSHTAIGDLVFMLTHTNTGTTVIFMQRVLKLDPLVGYGSDVSMNGNFMFTNNLASTFSSDDCIWCAADNAYALDGTNAVINGGSFAASSNSFAGTEAASYRPSDFNDFDGQSIAGTWRLTIRDEATNDIGSLGSWSFNATILGVPEPDSLMLFFAGGILITAWLSRWRAGRG